MTKKVIIVGAGIGGLSTALRLSARGYEVEIIEKNEQAGGRLNQIKKDGFTFDTGPSFFSMSYEFDELAIDAGFELPYEIIELDPLYSVHFAGKKNPYVMYKDISRLSEQFKDVEPDFEKKMNKYLDEGKSLFHDTYDIVVKQNFDSFKEYMAKLMTVNPKHLPKLFRNFWQQVSRYFDSLEAREVISLVSFFLGRTPFDTPAIYTLLSYTEFLHDGYYNVKGGMYKIVEGFVKELQKRNVKIHYNTEIIDFNSSKGKLVNLIDKNNHKWEGDIFVINGDAAVFRGKIFKRKKFTPRKLDKMKWTMGPLTFYLGINKKLTDIHHHNYYIGSNFKEYSSKVFLNPDVVEKPYYYVNVLSNNNPECAPDGCESLFFVCPVPDLRYKPHWKDKDIIVDSIINDFSERIGVDINNSIVSKTVYTPENWEEKFNLHRGSGLGLSHDLLQTGALRPKNFDEEFKNTFYVGASTIPGTGLPMCVIGSK